MKNLKNLLLLAFIGLSTSAFAQFTNSNASTSSTSTSTSGWNRVFIEYNPSKITTDVDGADDLDFKGFSIGYMKGISVTEKLPLFVEVGAALQYRAYKEDFDDSYYEYTEKINTTSLNIPVHLLYRFNVTNDFAIEPFFGFDFRFNIIGKYKIEAEGESEDFNLFDKDEMKEIGFEDSFKRFQAGWHIGVNLNYKPIYVGVHYGKDFNEIYDHLKVATTHITLGFNF